MIKVLHITAHLGGGVGRVITNVTLFRKAIHSEIEDIIVCLEPPHKEQVITTLRNAGVIVEISPGSDVLDHLIRTADIVQLEWWHHPLLVQWLSSKEHFFARLVIWSHTSGLHYPAIPASLIMIPQIFLFTTPVSFSRYDINTPNIVDVVHSSGGFEDVPECTRNFSKSPLIYGYTGTINPAKLHPQIIEFITAVDIPDFAVDFFGDPAPHSALEIKSEDNAIIAGKIHLRGYTDQLYTELQNMDVFVYILNPTHYGTTENGLLEAMACGVVPVVLNNPVESSIVKNGETGMIVDSPNTFALAIKQLHENPRLLEKMSKNASIDVRSRFSIEITERQLSDHYQLLMEKPKKWFNFACIFGSTPWQWFSSCLGDYKSLFNPDNSGISRQERLKFPVLYERSKSSLFQFQQYFPDDQMLNRWSEILEDDIASIPTT